jgi:hypothetical protein
MNLSFPCSTLQRFCRPDLAEGAYLPLATVIGPD